MRHLGGTAAAEISLCRRCVIHLLRRDNLCYSSEWQNKGGENSRAHLVNFVLNAKYKFFTKNHKSFLLIFEHRKSCLVVSSLLLFRRHFFYFGGGGGMLDDDRGAKIDGAGCVEVVLAVEAVVGWAGGG